jgi:para-nitrobenzyl esterase
VQSPEQAHELGARFAEGVGCAAEADVAACLRALDTAELLRWTENAADFLAAEVRWRPIVDGAVIPDAPEVMIAAGDWNQAPVLLGTTRDEFALFVAPPLGMPVATRDDYRALVEALFAGRAEEVLAQYPADDDAAANEAFVRMLSDRVFTCPTRELARAAEGAGGAAYLYSFEQEPSASLFGDIGVFHAAEIPFVFGTSSPLGGADTAPELSRAMQDYWTAFAHAGDPNARTPSTDAGAVRKPWPAYDVESDEHMVLALPLSTASGLRREACDFWAAFATDAP